VYIRTANVHDAAAIAKVHVESWRTTYKGIIPGELYAIYLLAPYQGQGIGRRLAITIVNRLMEEGMTALLIWVLAANPSRKFYERLGGRPVHEKPITIGGVSLTEIAYGWRDAHTLS
jgi:GNAT superfamily N-acetyltransferase